MTLLLWLLVGVLCVLGLVWMVCVMVAIHVLHERHDALAQVVVRLGQIHAAPPTSACRCGEGDEV